MKRVLFVTALSLGVFIAGAQNMNVHTEFGIKGGLDITNVHIDNYTNPDSKASFNLGIFTHVHLTRQFAFQPELLYSGQGYSQTFAGVTTKYSLNYVTIPLLGQVMFGDGFRLETGPQPGILTGARATSGDNSHGIRSDYKSADFSWVFGAGYVSRSGFGVDARYNLGLSNINDAGSNKITNRVFAVGVFFQFKQ